MTNEEAIENLEYAISGDCTENFGDFVDEIELAIEALKKQIPQKVEVSSYSIRFCSVCGGSVWQNADESNYCFRCGQKLE